MATHGKAPGQQQGAFRSTLAQAQGQSANQQQIAGSVGGSVNPYGSMAVRNPMRPAPATPPAARNIAAKPPAAMPPAGRPNPAFARVQTPSLGLGG